ncbi:MAG: hypothetical protein ABEI97_01855 [Candidatus Nanohaloarchaea archaeon]
MVGQVLKDAAFHHAGRPPVQRQITLEDIASCDNFDQFREEYGGWFLDSYSLNEWSEALTKDDVYEIVAEGHEISEDRK